MKNQIKETLTPIEAHTREACENTIKKHKEGFVACGLALAKIQQGRLYRSTHKSFESYCKELYGWGKSYAYQLIECAEIKTSPIGDQIKNKGQAKAIAHVPEKERPAVLADAAKSGKLTAASITEAAKKKTEEPQVQYDKTEFERELPEGILDDWNHAEEVGKHLRSVLTEVKCILDKGLENKDIIFAEIQNVDIAPIAASRHTLSQIIPFALCPVCHGGTQKKKCTFCRERGFISKFRWDNCVLPEVKAMLKKKK